MKRLVACLISGTLVAAGCTITVKPIPVKSAKKYKSRSHHNYSRAHRSTSTSTHAPEQASSSTNIKETWWIENYHKLEAAHGNYSIAEDEKIEPLPDGRFKVPELVLKHYQDLLLTKPTPKP